MNKIKKRIILIAISIFISIPLVFATTSYSSSDVVVDNTTTKSPIYLQDAIDEINYFCSINCPQGKVCKNNTPKCKRATSLHTEECTNSDTSNYCQADGYALNGTITYGNDPSTTTSGVLTTGDAFDCNVDGTGYNHRFYYVIDYYDTSTKTFNDKVAVLVYYSNTDDGVASTTSVAYDCSNQNYNGPVTAISELPTTTQWSNIRLYKDTRQILTEKNTTAINGDVLPTSFDYSEYSARLLTYQEIHYGCYDYNLSLEAAKGLSINCNFLFERTKYANSGLDIYGGWLETPNSSTSRPNNVFNLVANDCCVSISSASNFYVNGARPAIEILKSEISY